MQQADFLVSYQGVTPTPSSAPSPPDCSADWRVLSGNVREWLVCTSLACAAQCGRVSSMTISVDV